MAITKTNLYLRLRALDPWFKGTPQQFAEAIVAAMEVVAPFGITTFVTGSTMPSSNQGPWLKDGTTWYVWSDDAGSYVPQDISASLPQYYYIQADEPPTDGGVYIWFRVTENLKPAGIYLLLNGAWEHMAGPARSGPTAERPADPYPFEEFYDTDISCLLWYERGQWRTKSGVKGDLKYVDALTQEDALQRNPGWEIFGTGESDNVNWRGKSPAPASKDSDGSNPLTMPAGVTGRSAGDLYGIESQMLTNAQLGGYLTHIHGVMESYFSGDDEYGMMLRYSDYTQSQSNYGTPAYGSLGLHITSSLRHDNGTTDLPTGLDVFTSQPTQHPTNAVTQAAVQMAPPSIAMFLLRKT